MLNVGDRCPDVHLSNQQDEIVSMSDFSGRQVFIYFYPKADTPGCTQQSCLLRDLAGQVGDTVIIGISPDTSKRQAKFDTKYTLGFPLLADVDHVVAEAFGVWKEKSMYGKTYMGIERSAFLVSPEGLIERAWYKISPKDTPVKLLAALEQGG